MNCFANPFDMSQFFKCGFAISKLNPVHAYALLDLARRQTYIESDKVYGNGMTAPVTTNWASPFLPSRFDAETPDVVDMVGAQIVYSDSLPWFRKAFGRFTQTSYMINHYKPGMGMVWHNDNFDGTFCSILVYITGHKYKDSDGGWIEFGKVDDPKLIKENRVEKHANKVKRLAAVLPNHGVAVLVNNLNPLFLHRVEKLVAPKERYTFMSHFGYAEHTSQVRKRITS